MIKKFLDLKQWQRLAIALPLAAGMFALVWYLQSLRPDTVLTKDHWKKLPITVSFERFEEPGETAVGLLNGHIDIDIFLVVPKGGQIIIKSLDSIPCGEMDYPGLDNDDFGGAYYCGERGEVHVTKPGDTWQPTFVISHELLHDMGVPDGPGGVMAGLPSGLKIGGPRPIILLSDPDLKAVREQYSQERYSHVE